MPSIVPSELKCATDENGFYGTESAHTVSVSFTYELEFSDSSGLDEVLPSLERAFADALLPVFFSSGDCAQVGVAVHDNASLVLGVSTKPDDTVLDDVICNATTANNTCEILSGELFIFVADSGMESSIEDAAITTLKSGSENDDFLDAHVAINRVTFVDLETEGPIIGDPDPITGAPLGGDPRLVTFVIVGIVAGIAALFLILALLARKKRSDDNEEESSAGNSA